MRQFWKWFGIALLIGALVIAVGFLVPVFGTTAVRGVQTKNISNAKQLALAVRIYAMDYEGRFPVHLSELVPDYIPGENLDDFLYAAKIGEEDKPRLKHDWLYFGAGFDAANPPTVLIASPHAFRDGKKQKRIVVHPDGTGGVIDDEQYQAELRKTIEAMHKRFDAAKTKPE